MANANFTREALGRDPLGRERDDAELQLRLAAGDSKAWRAVEKDVRDRILGLLRRWPAFARRAADLAPDLAADVCVSLFVNISFYDPTQGPFLAWSFTIARNITWKACGRAQRNSRQLPIVQIESGGQLEPADSRPSAPEHPSDGFSRMRVALCSLVEQLGIDELGIFVLRHRDGLTMRAIAKKLSIVRGTRISVKVVSTAYRGIIESKAFATALEFMCNGGNPEQYQRPAASAIRRRSGAAKWARESQSQGQAGMLPPTSA